MHGRSRLSSGVVENLPEHCLALLQRHRPVPKSAPSNLKTPVRRPALCGGCLRQRQRAVGDGGHVPTIAGRDFVTPDDIKAMAVPVLEHRVILRPEFEIEGLSVPEVIQQILQQIAVPR